MIKKRCHVCNRIIPTRHNNKYCSRKCYDNYRKTKSDIKKQKLCPQCGKQFVIENHPERAIYCSRKCFGQSIITYSPKTCPICNRLFMPGKNSKYCSRECKIKSTRIKNTKTCQHCNKSFLAKRQELQYCSRKCLYNAKARAEKQCPVCGKMFTCDKPSQKYCSRACFIMTRRSDRIRGSRNFSARQKGEILERDAHKCVLCQSTKNLEVDHTLAFSLGGNSIMENGQALCSKCHVEKTSQDMELLKLQRFSLP